MKATNHIGSGNIRWQLLATVSALALLSSACIGEADAARNETDKPQLWVELGGQLDYLDDAQESFDPPFMAAFAQANMLAPLAVQSPPRSALDPNGKISFQPHDSDWVFSGSIRFGRSQAIHHRHRQTHNPYVPVHFTIPQLGGKYFDIGTKYPNQHVRYADGKMSQSERHVILDFQAGKDVGLGMFRNRGTSIVSAGVRFAQFNSKTSVALHGVPDLQYPNPGTITSFRAFRTEFLYQSVLFHAYAGAEQNSRSFRGLGPTLAWTGSMPFAGNIHDGELSLDLDANAAVLFGRQKAAGHHQTTTRTYSGYRWGFGNARDSNGALGKGIKSGSFVDGERVPIYNSKDFSRMRSVTVPNLGGSIGFSYRIENFKVSIGYRADIFFNAMAGGIDVHKDENRGFYGPFAAVSIRLGD